MYFSENLFWARMRPDDSWLNWVSTWVAYSLAGFVFLSLLAFFRVKSRWPLFLAGAAFGWLTEGVVVQTTYEALPLSISFTGLAWHALLSVWVGWYAVRKALFSADRLAALKLAVIIGIGYGLWAISWWLEPDGGVATLSEFAVFSTTATGFFILAVWLANWSAAEIFAPARPVNIAVAVLFGLYFALVAVPAAPQAVVILPVLLGLTAVGLWKYRARSEPGSLIDRLQGRIPPGRLFSLLAIPGAAVLVYALAQNMGWQWQTNWVLYLITTPLGLILYTLGLVKAWQGK